MNTQTTPVNESQYDYDYSDETCEIKEVVRFESILIPVFFALVITLSLAGNILVLVILALYENLKSLTNIFILNLAISDLVFTTGLPFWAIYHVHGWLFSELVCKIVSFVFFTGFYSSVLFLTVMTIYRYFAVVHNINDPNNNKIRNGVFVPLFVWILSIVSALPYLLHTTVLQIPGQDESSMSCDYETHVWKIIATFQQNIFFLVAFAVMAFCYIQILGKINKTQYKTKSRAVRLVFSIVAVFFIGWVPYNLVIFLKILADRLVPPFHECNISLHLEYAFCVSRLIAFSHCCLNPVFYAFVGVKFKSHLKSLLRCMFPHKNAEETPPVQMQNMNSQASMY